MQKLIAPNCADFGKPNIIIKQFPDTESYALIPKINSLKNKNVLVCQRLYPEPDKRIFELMLVLSRLGQATKKIELFVPYLPYAKQDNENKVGEAVSADVLCKLLKISGVKKLITYDCHFLPRPGNFRRSGLYIENRSTSKLLYSYAKKYFGKEKFLVISPDEGASYFTENAEGHVLKKHRKESTTTGKETEIYAHIHKIESEIDVEGKNLCILDDVISTGSTMMKTIEHLKEKGARRIIVGSSHGVFAGENIPGRILKSGASQIFIFDTISNAHTPHIKLLKLPQKNLTRKSFPAIGQSGRY